MQKKITHIEKSVIYGYEVLANELNTINGNITVVDSTIKIIRDSIKEKTDELKELQTDLKEALLSRKDLTNRKEHASTLTTIVKDWHDQHIKQNVEEEKTEEEESEMEEENEIVEEQKSKVKETPQKKKRKLNTEETVVTPIKKQRVVVNNSENNDNHFIDKMLEMGKHDMRSLRQKVMKLDVLDNGGSVITVSKKFKGITTVDLVKQLSEKEKNRLWEHFYKNNG